MISGRHLALLAALAGLSATPATAEWSTAGGTLLHPTAAVLTGAIDAATSLTVSCDRQRLGLTLTTRAANVHPPADTGEGTLRIVPDAGNWSWLQVTYRHDGGALIVEHAGEEVRKVVDEIIGAKATITYILDFVGGSGEVRWNGDAAKSTASGRAFLDTCFERATDVPIAIAPLVEPAGNPAPAAPPAPATSAPSQFGEAAPAQPSTAPAAGGATNQFGQPAAAANAPAAAATGQFGQATTTAPTALPAEAPAATAAAPAVAAKPPAWTIAFAPDPGTGGQMAILTGDLGHFDPGWFFALCDGAQRPGLSLISNDRATFPFAEGDELLMLSVEVDAEPGIEGHASYYVHDDRFFGVRLNDPAEVRAIATAITRATEDVAITIVRMGDRETRRWSAKNLDGLAEAAAQFNAHCYGMR